MSTWAATLFNRQKRPENRAAQAAETDRGDSAGVSIRPRVVDCIMLGAVVVVFALAWRTDAEPTSVADLVPTAKQALQQHVSAPEGSEAARIASLSARP